MPSNSNWRLEAISKAALNAPKRSFSLKNGKNQVGKSRNFEVAIPSALCSRRHCGITVENNCVSLLDTVSDLLNHILRLFFLHLMTFDMHVAVTKRYVHQ